MVDRLQNEQLLDDDQFMANLASLRLEHRNGLRLLERRLTNLDCSWLDDAVSGEAFALFSIVLSCRELRL